MSTAKVEHFERLRGTVRVPGDKSTSHRALMVSALADGESTIRGLSPGLDVDATGRIIEQLGASRIVDGDVVTVVGPPKGLHASDTDLDCGNSGTTMRLIAGVVSTVPGAHRLVGDASLSTRPMDRVGEPLMLMGANFEGRGERLHAPLHIVGSHDLRGITYVVPMASAQVKSAILFAALGAATATTVVESVRTRPTTEEMFSRAGVAVVSIDDDQGRRITVQPGRPLARNWLVPGDPSQAAFFAVLGCIHPDAELDILKIDSARERIGFLDVLQRMGATLSLQSRDTTASLSVRSSELLATEVHAREIPSVDEVPVLVVAASAARGVSRFHDVGELRVKESDRFEASLALARKLGCRAWSEGDDLFVEGLGSATRFAEFEIDAALDHRMVMTSAIAGCAGSGCSIGNAQTVASSYPDFFDDLERLS
ncbi:MAG TPA: 3-phosphoshikimate 1-carboxyvinyltransferase [Acidimicrobiales bacterium]|nr:3-phosphoshikimate 1-carboxyvinyltransferase [Acidimicrobiales bacterium]